MAGDGCFTRDFELENLCQTLTFYQKEVGDVSCVVWDASLVLARHLEKMAHENPFSMKGKRVLELGAGLGCVGITGACFGADVTMTDLPDVLSLLDYNIAANRKIWSEAGGCAKSAVVRWGESVPNMVAPQLLLLSDCVYYDESIVPLVRTMISISDFDTDILLCQELRETDKQKDVWKRFMLELVKYFDFTEVPPGEQHPLFRSSDIVLLRGAKRRVIS